METAISGWDIKHFRTEIIDHPNIHSLSPIQHQIREQIRFTSNLPPIHHQIRLDSHLISLQLTTSSRLHQLRHKVVFVHSPSSDVEVRLPRLHLLFLLSLVYRGTQAPHLHMLYREGGAL